MIHIHNKEYFVSWLEENIRNSAIKIYTIYSTNRGEIQRRLFTFRIGQNRVELAGSNININRLVAYVDYLYTQYPLELKEMYNGK